MRKRNYLAAVLLLFGFLLSSASAQSRSLITRTALSSMGVLSRSEFFEKEIADAARKEGIDPNILWTIAYNETRFRPWLTSPKNAQGLMQFMPATAVRFGLADPYEPAASIRAAARYVKYLSGLFDGRLDSILAAYNAGEGTVLAFLQGKSIRSNGKLINASGSRTDDGIPPYKETLGYVSQGLKIYRWLERQDRFAGTRPVIEGYAMNRGKTLKKNDPGKPDSSMPAMTVFYDPRSGKRFLVGDGNASSQPIDVGPVIISPDIKFFPAQKARSTFAGVTLRGR